MKVHTSQFKENIAQIGKEISSKITYTIDNTTTILDDEQLNVVSPHYKADILKSVMKQLDIDSNVDIPIGTEINYQFGVKVNGQYEYLDYGNYIVYKSEKQEDYNSYKIVAYDKMLYSMIDYEDLDITYPITIRNYLQTICTHLGLTFASASDKFTNYDKEISNEMYLDSEGNSLGYTFRDVLDELAQATASTICINNNDELEIRYIDDAGYEKDVSGSEISITDGQPHKVKDFKLSKLSTQYTTTGKSLLNPSRIEQATSHGGITCTYDADTQTITFNGTCDTDNTTFYFTNSKQDIANITANLTTMSAYYVSGSITTYFQWRINNSNWSTSKSQNLLNIATDKVISFSSTTSWELAQSSFSFRFNNGSVANNLKIKIMVANSTDTTYEPFTNQIPAPNPDYPQEVKVVNGYRNFFDTPETSSSNGVDLTRYSNGSIKLYGTSTAQANFYKWFDYDELNLKDGGTYTFYANQALPPYCYILIEKYNNNTWKSNLISPLSSSASSRTATIDLSGGNKIRFGVRTDSGHSYDISNLEIQLVEGEVSKPYVPYGNNYVYNLITQKNICPTDFTAWESGHYNSTGIKENYTSRIRAKNLIPVKSSTTYYVNTFSNNDNFVIREYDSTGKFIKNISGKPNTSTFTTSSNGGYISVSIYSNTNQTRNYETYQTMFTNGDIKPFICLNSDTDKTYIEHKEQMTLIPLNNNFIGGISTYKDQLLVDKDGHCYLNKKIGKVVLDGSETWITWNDASTGNTRLFGTNIIDNISKIQYVEKSNYFIGYSSSMWATDTQGTTVASSGYDHLRIKINKSIADNTPDFLTWLSTHNTTVYYVLAEPQLIDLNYTVDMELFSGINYITNSEDADMDLTYIYEFDTIDEDYFKDTKVDFGEKYGPINSIVLSRSAGADNINLRNEASILANGLCELKIEDNQIMNDNNRDECLQGIFDRLNGLEYYINDYASTGIMYYDLCDRYRAKIGNNTYECIMFNDEAIIEQGLQENIHTDMPVVSETEYQYTDTTDKRINQAYIIVNKQNGTITSLASRTKTLENNEILTNNKFNDYTPLSRTVDLETSVSDIQTDTYKKTEVKQILKGEFYDENNNQIVSEIVKTTSGTFDADGMLYEKSGSPVKTRINDVGTRTSTIDGDKTILFAGYVDENNTEYADFKGQTIVATENVIVKNYFVMPEAHSRIEKYENGGGMFYV